MADFVAVIRRAVDGLTDNTPEMRVKVYEKARNAVVRQLENMKPRPPEQMFQRQLDKLDEAIRQVEEEHAEALPADGPAETVAEVAVQPEVQPLPEVRAVEPVFQPQPVAAEPVAVVHSEPEAPKVEEPAPIVTEPVETQVFAAEPQNVLPEPEFRAPEPVEEAPVSVQALIEEVAAPVVEPVARAAEPEIAYREPVVEQQAETPRWAVEIDQEPDLPAPEPEITEEPVSAQMPKIAYNETDVVSGFNEFLKEEFSKPAVPPPPAKAAEPTDGFSWDQPFDELPELPKPVAFEQALEAKQKEIASQPQVVVAPKVEKKNARTELEDLIGFDRPSISSSATESGLPPEVTRAVSKLEGKSFQMQKQRRSGMSPLAMALIALGAFVVVGGSGFVFWQYRDNVTNMLASVVPGDTPEKVPATTKVAETTPADRSTTVNETVQDKKPVKETEVASLETDAGPVKFTQRLMADGTEAETEKVKLPVDTALPEGKTVAGQTEPSTDVAAVETKTDTTAEKPATDATALAVAQKMFLYEERLGQTSPVAVPGSVTWTVKNEAASEGAKAEPSIEAQLDVPARKIKALISFKRNTDVSLPASHIIEIVFSLPKDFEEGNIEGIQRIAFKQTEQDRGNPLIAVPAKITDDFHMIALNDDADARKANIELMKTRSWIDIPITYRNGRRALITLEKGATGTEAFNKVIAEWNALSAQAATNN